MVSPEGSGVPLTGPWNGVLGGGCVSWTIATTTSRANKTISVMNVPRRIPGG